MAGTRRTDAVTTTSGLLVGACAVWLVLLACGKPAADAPPAPTVGPQVGVVERTDRQSGGEARPSSDTPAQTSAVGAPEPSGAAPTPFQPVVQQHNPPPQPPDAAPSPTGEVERKARTAAELAQWQAWFAAARNSPDVGLRLHALDQWAQRPGEALDPVTYGLVDEDEQVRVRAQELYQEQLTRDAAEAVPVQQEQHDKQSEP